MNDDTIRLVTIGRIVRRRWRLLTILAVVTLGYLGLGVQPPTPEWGSMISDGQNYILTSWWLATIPGLAVVFVGVAFSLIGDGLADLLRAGDR